MSALRAAARIALLIAALAQVGGTARAQAAQPGAATTASPHGSKPPPLAASAGELPAGHPPLAPPLAAPAASGSPPPAASAGMPPGHPPTPGARRDPHGGGMPPGHPSAPRGRGDVDGMYEPPEDEVVEEAGWAPGTIEVQIRDADGRPVEGAPVILGIVHNTVATGEQREKLTSTTDGDGNARFEGMRVGMSTTYAASSQRGPSRFEAPPLNLPEKGGMRILLHVYDTVTDIAQAQIGMRALAFFSLREDAIQTEQVLEVFNLGRTAWQAEVPVQLPPGFKAFNRAEEGGVANVDPTDEGYVLRGTFRPGRTSVGFRWQLPLENDPEQTVKVGLPPRVAQARVIAEASKTMELLVEGAPAARRTRNRDGRSVLVTERSSPAGDKGIAAMAVTLRGLPTKGAGRWIAAGLAGAMIALAALGVVSRRGRRETLAEDAREDLVQARDALLDELVALERAKIRGQVGPRTYERVRAAMLDALANVVAELDVDAPPAWPATANAIAPEEPPSPQAPPGKRRRPRRPRADRGAEDPP